MGVPNMKNGMEIPLRPCTQIDVQTFVSLHHPTQESS